MLNEWIKARFEVRFETTTGNNNSFQNPENDLPEVFRFLMPVILCRLQLKVVLVCSKVLLCVSFGRDLFRIKKIESYFLEQTTKNKKKDFLKDLNSFLRFYVQLARKIIKIKMQSHS